MTKKAMKVSWAPWRMEFIEGKREKGCIFCNRIRRKKDQEDLILYRGREAFVILNKYPYNNGHLMVVPYRHISSMEAVTNEESAEIFDLIRRTTAALQKTMGPQGFNVGLNLGKAAGAGIDDHLHFHVVPRWFADTNFWPVIGSIKTMPEHLMKTYVKLKKNFK